MRALLRESVALVLLLLGCFNIASVSLIANNQYDVLFVLHDAGESLGLQPVIDNFIENEFNISILCIGEYKDIIVFVFYLSCVS